MRCSVRFFGIVIAITLALSLFSPTRADAHGIGGLEASDTSASVVSVLPSTSAFSITSIENGARVRIAKKGSQTVYVLGVDGEDYIRITHAGTYINQKSATRLINASTSSSKSSTELASEFAHTSSDPHAKPEWKKVSSGQQYTWHDHRTHYMGTVPSSVTLLGTNTLPIRVDNKQYVATFKFTTAATPMIALPFLILGLFFLGVFLMCICMRSRFISIMNKPFTLTVLIIMTVLEFAHVVSYMKFSQQSISSEVASCIYGIALIVLTFTSVVKIVRSHLPWSEVLKNKAPLLCATGFVGLAAGTIIEYRTLIDPFPASTLSPGVARWGIVILGCLSSLIFAVGLINIKQDVKHESIPAPL